MEVKFVEKRGGPEKLLCDAEIHFGADTPLAGMKLVGLSVWRGKDGQKPHVTLPARLIGPAEEKNYYDFLRAADGPNAEVVRGMKAWVVQEYERQIGSPERAATAPSVASMVPPAVAPTPAVAPAR